jgi:hypothetical protein
MATRLPLRTRRRPRRSQARPPNSNACHRLCSRKIDHAPAAPADRWESKRTSGHGLPKPIDLMASFTWASFLPLVVVARLREAPDFLAVQRGEGWSAHRWRSALRCWKAVSACRRWQSRR